MVRNKWSGAGKAGSAAGTPKPERRSRAMYVDVEPLLALIAGILILFVPRMLSYIVAFYLIIIGVVGLVR
jgi:hypothetical protein